MREKHNRCCDCIFNSVKSSSLCGVDGHFILPFEAYSVPANCPLLKKPQVVGSVVRDGKQISLMKNVSIPDWKTSRKLALESRERFLKRIQK